jgi:hypothetical protein
VKVIQNYALTLSFVKEKVHRHSKSILIYAAKQSMITKTISRKISHILEDNASGVQVGDMKQVTIQNLFEIR